MDALLWDHSLNDDVKEVPQSLKPEEEISRFTVDEGLSDLERINLFLTGGQQVQQRKAIEGLPALLKSKGRAGWESVRDNLVLTLKQLDVDAQVCAAEGLRTAVQQHSLAPDDAAECLLPFAISNVKVKDRTEEEQEAWLLLLLELVPQVGPAQLLEHVLSLALAHGEVNEPVANRVVCCRLLGAMVPHLPPTEVTARFTKQLMAACQDTDYQVRIAAAEQLPALARVLGHTATVDQLLPELTELLGDDEVQVRMVALNGLVALCELLPSEVRVAHLLPLVRRHMQPLELELPLQRALAAAFPPLLAAVHDDLEPSDAGLMYSCFRHLAARTNVDLRRACAQCVAQLMCAPLPGSSPSYLHDTWTDLALDHDEQVRLAIARQLHVMARQVPPSDAARLMRRPLAALLRDTSPAVREGLLSGLADTLQALAVVDEMHRDGLAADIHQGLLVLQGNITDSWRCQQHLADALPQLPSLLGPEVLAEHWAPYAFSLLLNGAAAVKPSAARGLACLLRGCRRERPRTDLYCRIIRELAWGRSCFARLAFIQLCTAALGVFSCRWFKERFLLGVMELLCDAVPNVRLAALGLLPSLKQTIRLPEDVQQLEQLNSAMSNLMTDNDRDVAHAARTLHATFKRTPLRMTGGAGLLDINGSSSGAAAAEFEAADKAKEEGEVELTLVADEVDRLHTEWLAVAAERKGRRNPLLAMAEAGGGSSNSSSSPASRPAGGKVLGSGGSSSSSSSSAITAGKPYGATGTAVCFNPNSGSSSSVFCGSGKAAAAVSSFVGGSTAAGSWPAASGSASDRRFGSGAASSSSSPTGSSGSMSLRTAAATASAVAGFSSVARAGAGRVAVGVGGSSSNTSSSSSSLGSPRPAALNSSFLNSSSSSINSPGSSTSMGPGSPLSSPTGSSLLAHMRLPVLAGGAKPGPAGGSTSAITSSSGSSSSIQAGGLSTSSSNSISVFSTSSSTSGSSSSAAFGGSRLGWSGALGGSGLGPPSAAAASRQQPGSLALSAAAGAVAGVRPGAGLFSRPPDPGKACSVGSSSRKVQPQGVGPGVLSSSSSSSSSTHRSPTSKAAGTVSAAQNSRDAAARRFK